MSQSVCVAIYALRLAVQCPRTRLKKTDQNFWPDEGKGGAEGGAAPPNLDRSPVREPPLGGTSRAENTTHEAAVG